MPFCRETPTSRNGSKDGSFELTFVVEGTIDDAEAEALAFAKAPVIHRGLPRSPLPTTRNVARGIFEVTFTYELENDDQQNPQESEPQGELPTLGKLSIKPIGGHQHVTQCLYQKGFSNVYNTQQIETERIVALDKDGVKGCDIDAPGEVITLEKLWLPPAITGAYITRLRALKGHTNLAPYTMRWALRGNLYEMEFESGELRYAGTEISTSITPRGVTAWSFVYTFIQSNNRRNIEYASNSQPIYVNYIGGHDFVWSMYEKKALNGSIKAMIESPIAVFVSVMYPQKNFVAELGF